MSASFAAKHCAAKPPKPAASRQAGRRGAAKQPAGFSEKLWKKIIAWCALVCTPAAALLLVVFVWQISGALDRLAAEKTAPAAAALSASNSGRKADKRLHFAAQPAPARQGQGQAANSQNKAWSGNADLRFLHAGLLYSSFLVLIASLCIAVLLVHFMARDKHQRYDYQTLLVNADSAVESRVRHRTAHLQAARHLAEKERQRAETLLQDTSHRVGNSLATVSSLLGLQLRQCRDAQVQKALLSARDRILAISAAHRRLRLSKDMETAAAGDFLSAVISDVESGLTASERRHIRIETRFEPWLLPARDVTSLGIILGELLTNAVKHAFPDGRQGKITVSFGKAGGKTLRLIVEDDGIGLPPAPQPAKTAKAQQPAAQGLGRIIITQLAQQFDAKPQFAKGKNGGSRVTVPLRRVKAENKKQEAEKAAA